MHYFHGDPVEIVHRYTERKDIEIAAVLCSWIAFGNRKQIHIHCDMFHQMLQPSPSEYLDSEEWRKYQGSCQNLYRILFYRDFYDIMRSLYDVYSEYPTLEDAVIENINPSVNPQLQYLDALTRLIHANGIPKDTKSACKRLCLMLRWLVRRDDGMSAAKKVDFGLWRRLDPSRLLIPLDVHVLKTSRAMGLLTRTTADIKAAIELTENVRCLFPEDPTVFDYALFTPSIENKNKHI